MSTREAYAKNQPIRGNVTTGMDRIWNVPRVSVYSTAAQNVGTSGVAFMHVFDTVEYDTEGMWGRGGSTTRITCITTGIYLVTASITWAANATGYRICALLKNGTVQYAGSLIPVSSGTFGTWQTIAWPITMNAGDYVENLIQQASGGALLTDAGSANNRYSAFTATFLSTLP
jgi:hypothetical protein